MASMKAEKSVGTSLFGQAKKEPASKSSELAPKARVSKAAPKKAAAPKATTEPKKKPAKGGKSAAKP